MLARRVPSLAALLTAATLLAVPAAHAASFVVTTTDDGSDATVGDGVCKVLVTNACSLRAALQQANSTFGPDTVSVPGGTFVLTIGSALPITGSVTVTGAGARETTIDGPDDTFALNITGGSPVTVRGLAITGAAVGAAVSNADALFDRVAIRDNTWKTPSTAYGAGLRVNAGANVQLLRSSVTGNRLLSDGVYAGGGGIDVGGGALTAVASTIAGNSVGGPTGDTRPTNAFGGGMQISSGSASLRHVTVAGNSIVSDTASQRGGNLFANDGTAFRFEDTIVTGGTEGGGTPVNCEYHAGLPTLAGVNLDSATTCMFGSGGLNSADPLLRPLGNFGGGTDTAPPLLLSPAVNAASACVDGGDQRGAAAAGGSCDIGAAELSTDLSLTIEASRASVASGGDVTYVLRAQNAGPDPAVGVAVELSATPGQVTVAAASTGTCTLAVRCEIGTLDPGASATVTVVARAAGAGPLVAAARVTAATPDANAANDSASVGTTVDAVAAQPLTPAPLLDRLAPSLGALKLRGRARSGKTVTFTSRLSEAATVTLKIERLTAGRRSGARCRSGLRKGSRCTIAKTVGSVKRKLRSGTVKLLVPATLSRRKLARGRYRLTATARDATGNSSKRRTRTFTVVR